MPRANSEIHGFDGFIITKPTMIPVNIRELHYPPKEHCPCCGGRLRITNNFNICSPCLEAEKNRIKGVRIKRRKKRWYTRIVDYPFWR